MLIGIFLASAILAYGLSMCEMRGGSCYTDYDLQTNYGERCPNDRPERISGEDGEELCEGFGDDDGALGRDQDEGINCCMPRDEDDGVIVVEENWNLLLSVRNVGVVNMNPTGERPCCAEEGYAPSEIKPCCDGMPEDGVLKNLYYSRELSYL